MFVTCNKHTMSTEVGFAVRFICWVLCLDMGGAIAYFSDTLAFKTAMDFL